jgi:hypothetical protein
VKKPEVEVLGWRIYTGFAIVMLVGRTAKFSKMTLVVASLKEMNITFSANSSVGHSCSPYANCLLP